MGQDESMLNAETMYKRVIRDAVIEVHAKTHKWPVDNGTSDVAKAVDLQILRALPQEAMDNPWVQKALKPSQGLFASDHKGRPLILLIDVNGDKAVDYSGLRFQVLTSVRVISATDVEFEFVKDPGNTDI